MSRASPSLAVRLALLALVATATAAPAGPLGTQPPAALGTPGGPSTPSGVWENDDSLELITQKGFLVRMDTADGMVGVTGRYLSCDCLTDNSYIAANEQAVTYANGTTAPGPDPPTPGTIRLGKEAPTPLANLGGPTTSAGVWENASSKEIAGPKGFVSTVVTTAGMGTIKGKYLSYKCLDANSYIAVNQQVQTSPNGTAVSGHHCEYGVRNGNTLSLTFSTTDCEKLAESNAAPDIVYNLAFALPGVNTECVDSAQDSSPAPAPPASSSAVRAALASAMTVAVIFASL